VLPWKLVLDGLIRSLANYTKDPVFNKALDAAVKKKATSGADLITLFTTEYKNASAGAKLAPYFVTRSNEKIKYDASDDAVGYIFKRLRPKVLLIIQHAS
jgi:SecD/SecF fusion protein